MELANMVFIAFGKNVVALDRTTGIQLWTMKIPKGSAYPALLLDGEQLFVSAMGYTYCLDPYTGHQVWENDLPGMGVGVASIATTSGSTGTTRAAAHSTEQQQQSSRTAS